MDNQAASPAESRPGLPQIAVIAIAAGAFSGLFGVGGGSVIVPLLVIWCGFNEKVATGTSLLAIALIALIAAASHATFGSIDVLKGMLVGVPAVGGVVLGTAVQQRLSDRVLSLLFAVMLLTIATLLLV